MRYVYGEIGWQIDCWTSVATSNHIEMCASRFHAAWSCDWRSTAVGNRMKFTSTCIACSIRCHSCELNVNLREIVRNSQHMSLTYELNSTSVGGFAVAARCMCICVVCSCSKNDFVFGMLRVGSFILFH